MPVKFLEKSTGTVNFTVTVNFFPKFLQVLTVTVDFFKNVTGADS